LFRTFIILSRMNGFPPLLPRDATEIIIDQIANYWTLIHKNSSCEELSPLFSDIIHNCRDEPDLDILEDVFCMLFYVRDISHGLGLRQVFYMMMMHLYDAFPMLALSVYPILLGYYDPLPYGSWRDVVGICDYLNHHSHRRDQHPIILHVLEFLNQNLKRETVYFLRHGKCDTNLAKWIPREKSQYGWIFSRLARSWSNGHIAANRTYRKLVSKLSASIEIIETHMCNNKWGHINAYKITHGAMAKYWYALFDQSRDFLHKHSSYDRVTCARKIGRHLLKHTEGVSQICRVYDMPIVFPIYIRKYVAYALHCIQNQHASERMFSSMSDEIFRLNHIWERIIKGMQRKYGKYAYTPIMRITESLVSKHTCDTIGKALLLFALGDENTGVYFDGHKPKWITIQHTQSFISQIETIYRAIQDCIFPCMNYQFFPYIQKKTIIITNGFCSLENDAQKNPNEYTSVFNDMSAVLFNKRYHFVRRKFHIIVRPVEVDSLHE
jgi:hypothetical protein